MCIRDSYYKELNRRKNKEISFSELPDVLVDKMAVWDLSLIHILCIRDRLWVVLVASVSFGVYKNFTAIDQHTTHEKEIIELRLQDTNGIENFVRCV